MKKITVPYAANRSGVKNVYVDEGTWCQVLQACQREKAALQEVIAIALECGHLRGQAFHDAISSRLAVLVAGPSPAWI